MSKPFATEYNLFAAIHSYCELLRPMTSIRAYSGSTKLYLMTGLGVNLYSAYDLKKLADNLAQDNTLITPPTEFIRNSIAANCITYVDLLSKLICKRLASRDTQDIPSSGGIHPRLSYNISAQLAQQITVIIKHKSNWGIATAFQNLADMAMIEYAHTVQVNGIGVPNTRCDDVLIKLIESLTDIFYTYTAEDPRMLHLPILSTVLCIARLLFADFNPLNKVPQMGPLNDRIWLSDSTLAALPWPSFGFVKGFSEHDAGLITQRGWTYLHHISSVYPDKFVNAA